MPWAVIEHFDEDDGELTTHVVPFVPVKNTFKTRDECEAFLANIEAIGSPTVSDEDDNIIGLHIGHVLSPKCPCQPKPWESDDSWFNHNAAS